MIIRHWPRTFTDEEKADLVSSLSQAVTRVFCCEPGSVSIAVESIEPAQWMERVHIPEIEQRAELLWKQPNYSQPVPTAQPAPTVQPVPVPTAQPVPVPAAQTEGIR